MTYSAHAAAATSPGLRQRVTACAAQEGASDPPRWTSAVIWSLITSEWIGAWASAEAGNPGGDHGSNEAVITDAMILAAVQPRLAG